MACGRRLLGPVRIPVPPHPQRRSRGLVLQSVRLPRSSGGPRGLPLRPCRLEARLAACVERDHLGWTRHRFGACRDPYEMKVHLGSSLSCRASGISGVAVSKPTTSCGSATELAARWSDRPDSNRHRGDHHPGCLPLHHSHKDGRRVLRLSTGAERCSSASRSHPLHVSTPASHRRGPPGACPAP
jgi:hypothetical protein